MKLSPLSLFATLVLLPVLGLAQLPPKTSELKDTVTDLLQSALTKYRKSDLNGASEDLDVAHKLIDARRGDRAATLLPAINGWISLKAEKQEAGLLGASSSWKRTYENKEKTIKAELVLDSPLIAQLTPLLTNPSIANAAGFEIRRVEGHDALVKKNGEGVELDVWIGSGLLFKLTGTKVKESEAVLFAKNFDLREMEKLKKDGAEKK